MPSQPAELIRGGTAAGIDTEEFSLSLCHWDCGVSLQRMGRTSVHARQVHLGISDLILLVMIVQHPARPGADDQTYLNYRTTLTTDRTTQICLYHGLLIGIIAFTQPDICRLTQVGGAEISRT